MAEKFLKARIPAALYEAIQTRASMDGKRLGTFVRELLESETQAIGTLQALARIEAFVKGEKQGLATPEAITLDNGTLFILQEIRLIVRELAMESNAQILARVAAQLKTFHSKLI